MPERRKLYTGEESAGRGLLHLRIAAIVSLLLTAVFIHFFNRAKRDAALAAVNPFAGDPFDAVGSFGIQLGFICATLAVIRAFRTDLKTESLSNRYTYAIRSMAVSQLAIIVTMLANAIALVRYSSQWIGTESGNDLAVITGGLFLLASLFSYYLMRLARRREVCSQNPLRQRQMVPFLILLGLLCLYPAVWRDGTAGAILSAIAGMLVMFFSVALLSKAMFPCPDIPEKDLIDDLTGIFRDLTSRAGFLPRRADMIQKRAGSPRFRGITDFFNPRLHEWNLLALIALLMGFSIAFAEIFGDGAAAGFGRALLVGVVFIVLESAGVFLGYALLRRFLGIVRSA